MGTIAQEITRIQGAKSDLATSIANKGVTVPAATKIDGYAVLVDQIQQGGQENAFLESTDLSYMFDHIDTQEKSDKYLALYNRVVNNTITNLQHTFDYSYTDYLLNFDFSKLSPVNVNAAYMFSYVRNNGNCNYLDLRNIKFKNAVNNMFSNASYNNGILFHVKFNKDTFKDATNIQSIASGSYGSFGLDYYDPDSDIIDFSNKTNISSFASFEYWRYNGSDYFKMRLKIDNCTNISSFCNRVQNTLANDNMEYEFIDAADATSFGSAFAPSSGSSQNKLIKSIKGVNLSGATTTQSIFNTSTSSNYNYTNLSEFTVKQGTKIFANNSSNLTFNMSRIWPYTADTVLDGQTVGYWFERFANSLGATNATGNRTITINSTLFDSLTETQMDLIMDKGYLLSSAA